jgi:hypothetical protein
MSLWPPLDDFVPIAESGLPGWRKLASVRFLGESYGCPIADSELLLCSHHLPIAIVETDLGLDVIALTGSAFTLSTTVSNDGRWVPPYSPIALRCLPLTVDLSGRRLIAPSLMSAKGALNPFESEIGVPSREMMAVSGLLSRLDEGRRKLRRAAERLFVAGVLVSLRSTDPIEHLPDGPRLYSVDEGAVEALAGPRVAHLANENFLPLDLAEACVFSRRLLKPFIRLAPDETESGPVYHGRANLDDFVHGAVELDIELDRSELFDVETLPADPPIYQDTGER